MLYKILSEKEKKLGKLNCFREGMKMMGMTNTAFYLSWYITYTISYSIIMITISFIV